MFFSALGQTDLARVSVTGARTAYDKHKDTSESKGVKAYFLLDDNGLFALDRVKSPIVWLLYNSQIDFRLNFNSNEKKQKLIETIQTMMMIHRLYLVGLFFFFQ